MLASRQEAKLAESVRIVLVFKRSSLDNLHSLHLLEAGVCEERNEMFMFRKNERLSAKS